MKHKIFKSLFAFILICSIFSLNLFSVGAVYQKYLDANGIEITKTKYVTTVEQNNVIRRTINESSMKSLKNSLSKQALSQHEQNIEIMKTLGFEEKTIEGMTTENIDQLFEDVVSLETQTVYMIVKEDGSTSIIGEDECLAATEAYNAAVSTAATTSSDNDGWGNWTDENGALRMTISCAYIDPASMNGQKGWYDFHAWYEWLILPNFREKDAMSIAVPTCSWDTLNAPGAYSSTMFYNFINANGDASTATVTTPEDFVVAVNGVYSVWDLPNDNAMLVNYIQCYIHARARVTQFNEATSITAYLRYSHTYYIISVTPSFGWDLTSGKIGVSVNSNINVHENAFYYNVNYTYTP